MPSKKLVDSTHGDDRNALFLAEHGYSRQNDGKQ